MENVEKKTEERETKNVKMDQRMTERANRINRETYWYLVQLLDLNVDVVLRFQILNPPDGTIPPFFFRQSDESDEKYLLSHSTVSIAPPDPA